MSEKNIAEMNAKELAQHIDGIEQRHKSIMKRLRALLRVLEAEEANNGSE